MAKVFMIAGIVCSLIASINILRIIYIVTVAWWGIWGSLLVLVPPYYVIFPFIVWYTEEFPWLYLIYTILFYVGIWIFKTAYYKNKFINY